MHMLLRPRWLIAHAVVAAIAVLFVSLGLWQLRRHDERRAETAVITANLTQPVVDLDELLATAGHAPDELLYRPVRVTGRYRPAEEVLLTPRSDVSGRAGHHVVTPLQIDDTSAVLVDRGWVPFEENTPPVAAAAPPEGSVVVEGLVVPTRNAARAGNPAGESDRITYLSAVDTDRLQPQIDIALLPLSVLLQRQEPDGGAIPVPGQLPDTDEGPHLSYAWQWFGFTAVVLIGYPLLIRRSLRGSRSARTDGRQLEVG